MKCPQCHSEVSEDSEFCSKCGTRVPFSGKSDSSVTRTMRAAKLETLMGTVAYMFPEQARGKAVDSRTDIWSLGIVLYEVLSGKRPFQGEHDQSLIYGILHEEPGSLKKARPGTAPEPEQIIGQALAKRPADRYKTIEEFRGDMEAVAEGLKPRRYPRL
ncbi:MAG: protein kinase family protein [Acidobacteriota bacterium]